MPELSLRQMRYFIAVAEERHFGRAAARLHITQPPLSRQVAELEAALGLALLVRDPRQVRLTPAGEQALAEFRAVVEAAAQAARRIAAHRDALPRLRLGLLNWLDLNRLPDTEQRLRAQGLVAGVDSQFIASHEAVAAVRGGRLDAALVAAPIETAGTEAVTLGRLRMVALVPARSPLARRRTLTLADLAAEPPFHRFRRAISPRLWDHFDRQYRSFGFRPGDEAPATELMGVMARIGGGQGCTLVPEPLAVRRYAGVARRQLRECVTTDVALVTAPDLGAGLRAALTVAARALLPASAEAQGPPTKRP